MRMIIIALAGLPLAASAGERLATARTDANGVTRFCDAAGRTAATVRTDSNGVTHFYDRAGRTGRYE